MAEEIRTLGITSIKLGTILGTGGMATTLTALGATFEGTATLEQAEATETNFFSEESDTPIETISVPGVITLKWAIVDFTPATLQTVLGGDIATTKWIVPAAAPTVEKSIEIITRKNLHIEITRAKISARLSMALGKANLGQVMITATVLVPTLAGDNGIRIFYSAT